jgi:outer membrane protein assembly factor BamB
VRIGPGAAAALAAVAGCAVAAMGPPTRRGGDPAAVGAALQRAGTPSGGPVNASRRALAFVLLARSSGETELVAFDLEGARVLWHEPAEVAARVAVAGPVIVHADRTGALVARDVSSGKVKWQKSLDLAFTRIGYAAHGDTVVEVVQIAGGSSARSRDAAVIAYDAASGRQRFSTDVGGPVGAPAAWGNLLAVPRQSQWVTLIDAHKGEVVAEILSREEAATFVKGLPEGLFFGSRGVFLASASTAGGERKRPGYLEAKLPTFVRPFYHHDMYVPEQNAYSAIDRNRLLWRVSAQGPAGEFSSGLVIVHNFRFFFGLEASTGKLRWAYSHPRTDAIASEHTGRAVVFVTAEGTFGALDAQTGRRIYQATLAPPGEAITVLGATFDADGFTPSGSSAGEPSTLSRTLSSIIWDPDRRFADVRMFALDELTKLPGREVTEELLKALDGGDVVPAPVLKKAMDALVERQDKSMLDLYLQALQVRPDYTEDRQPKRLEFFARALAQLKAHEAVPALVDHLRLPDTDLEAVRAIADAVIELEAREALEAFEDFLLEYRADPEFARHPTSLTAACDVLLKLGGSAERALLLFVAEEPQTIEAVSTHIRRSLVPEELLHRRGE